ncbi:AfsR/SARP family transcriptional regulator [Isoptericola haloaureus]|uniref:BTAD domain-containing putative transcriptional regulator n=1 Tax=Isoptericola haloaureus TaxID=1542902 RepID=A0ABU7Z2Q6_9MICO
MQTTSRPAGSRSREVSVQLLGGFAVSCADGPVDLPVQAQRLVAVLALQGRTGRRRLADRLWCDVAEDRALASLRTCLWRTNKALPGLVETTGCSVGLGLDPEIDVHRLTDAAHSVHDPARAAAATEVALAAGELLPDWEDRWLDEERERLRQVRLHLLENGAALLAGHGRFGLAIEAALAALVVDDLRESAHRTVIAIHLAEGNVAEARRAYTACRRTLQRALGVDPTPQTATLLAV